jgi:hypothetical protein
MGTRRDGEPGRFLDALFDCSTSFVLASHGGTVVKIADAINAEGAFDRLRILVDALQDAGCDRRPCRRGRDGE